jgi:hypothetical protein
MKMLIGAVIITGSMVCSMGFVFYLVDSDNKEEITVGQYGKIAEMDKYPKMKPMINLAMEDKEINRGEYRNIDNKFTEMRSSDVTDSIKKVLGE